MRVLRSSATVIPNGTILLAQYNCVACNEIPGLFRGHVGPPLTGFAERQFIAGSIVNLASGTIDWIVNPKKYKRRTAMPVLDASPRNAIDIPSYLIYARKLVADRRDRADQRMPRFQESLVPALEPRLPILETPSRQTPR